MATILLADTASYTVLYKTEELLEMYEDPITKSYPLEIS